MCPLLRTPSSIILRPPPPRGAEDIPLTPSLCKSIVVPYVDINAKVTNFFPFCTIGISMYQKRILPCFIIPSTFSPQASSPLERSGQISTHLYPLLLFFFPLSARGPTRRRNSTGLAELWGGWPIEQERDPQKPFDLSVFRSSLIDFTTTIW